MKKRTWIRTVTCAIALALVAALCTGCPLMGDESKEEKINRILRDRAAQQVIPEDVAQARSLLAQNGVSDFALEEENTWLFWSKNDNKVDIIKSEQLVGANARRKFAPGFDLIVEDGEGALWYPLVDYGDLASRLASAQLTAGSYDTLAAALGYRANELPYFFCEQLLKNSVVFNGRYFVGGEDALSVCDTAQEAMADVQERGIVSALLCSEQAAVFAGFEMLTQGFVADAVDALGAGAFSGCVALEQVSLPARLQSVGAAAFQGCTALTGIELGSVARLGESAFLASGLERVTLPAELKEIPLSAFAYCGQLTSVAWSGVTEIGDSAFYLCGSLESVSGPAVQRVGKEAFFLCEKLQSADFVAESTQVGTDAFFGTGFAGRE